MKQKPHFILTLAFVTLSTFMFTATAEEQVERDTLRFSRYPSSFNYYSPFKVKQSFLLRFTEPVAIDRVAQHLQFVSKGTDKQTIGIDAVRPTIKQIRKFGYSLIASNAGDQAINHFVLIEPQTNFTFKEWTLVYQKGLASMHGNYRINNDGSFYLGKLSPFKVESVRTQNPYNDQNSIVFRLNKVRLNKEHLDNKQAIKYFEVEPKVENLSLYQSRYELVLYGDFETKKQYKVSINPGLVANDGVVYDQSYTSTIKIKPRTGYVSLPTFNSAQHSGGNRSFSAEVANVDSLRTRIKKLKGDNLLFAIRGYREGYKGDGKDRTIPFSLIAGKTIHESQQDTKAPIDETKRVDLDWSSIDAESEYGAYYISADGGSSTEPGKSLGAHSILQRTDIGLAWKKATNSTLLYVHSIASSIPKANVDIKLLGEEGEVIHQTKTDKSGLVKIDSSITEEKELWLDASIGKDRHLLSFTHDLDNVYPYSYGVPFKRNNKGVALDRRTMLFSDRDVYKPGETVYIKCISRLADGDSLLPPEATTGQFRVMDFRGRRLIDQEITLSKNGTWDDEFVLPEEGLGNFTIEVDFNTEESGRNWNLITHHRIKTAEFRANTFELSLDTSKTVDSETIEIPISASYYMGKPLNKAKLSWTAYHQNTFPTVSGLKGFRFGDHFSDTSGESAEGKGELSDKGEATINFDVVLDEEIPAPRAVNVFAQVTDVNQQTISKRSKFMVHSSDFYIGVKSPDDIKLAGDEVAFQFANVNTKGKIYEKPVDVSILIEKITYNTVKIKGSDGKIRNKSEKHVELIGTDQATLHSKVDESGLPLTATHEIKFAEAGQYMLTFESMDDQGRRALTRQLVSIVGVDSPTWAWHKIRKVDLIANQSEYQIGQTAKVLLRTPMFGNALITTERAGVRSTQVMQINQHETILEIPIKAGDAPNIFVSAYLVRGTDESPHQQPSVEYRIGYCQLDIEDPKDSLEISIEIPEQEFYLPGSEIAGGIAVKDFNGNPVANTEVVLYAVDEGVLSLTNYTNPNPANVFHRPFPLSVVLGQSISDLFPEDSRRRDYNNKGFVIGGGSVEADESVAGDLSKMRKDFKTVALWVPDLTTDENGLASFKFTAPDNLTTYRFIAVATEGNRFAHQTSPLTINKPIMIEPALPAFGNLGDRLDVAAIIHNNTPEHHEVLVEILLDERSTFIKKLDSNIPTLLTDKFKSQRTKQATITIKAGESQSVRWPLALIKEGEAEWTWKVTSKKDSKIIDQTVSKLTVNYPLPLLRSEKSFVLTKADQPLDLLANFDKELLRNMGQIDISVSNSRLHEGGDGLDYLLRYPYGCVEQTSSSTLPWLSTQSLKSVLPNLQRSDVEIENSIKKGVDRLLTMQTYDGGLSYWPGANESILWGSAYGGLTLALAEKSGQSISEQRLNKLWDYLSSQLREMSDSNLAECCLASYTLAVAGEAEPAYLTKLYKNRSKLNRSAKSLLAMAISETAGNNDGNSMQIETLLKEVANSEFDSNSYRYNNGYQIAAELIARSNLTGDTTQSKLLNQLMDVKRQRFGWGNTYSNAWALMAMAKYADQMPDRSTPLVAKLQSGQQGKEFTFAEELTSQQAKIVFDYKRSQPLESLSLTKQSGDRPVYVTAKLAARPKLLPAKPVNAGFNISRQYFKMEDDGQAVPLKKVSVGDLVKVQIEVEMPMKKHSYLAIDDPLPANLEAINSQFATQQVSTNPKEPADIRKQKQIKYLSTSRREIRADRALFFCDWAPSDGGKYQIVYLARVIAAGECTAPPTKIESMYAPEIYGLSATQVISSEPLKFNKKGKKFALLKKK